MRVPGRIGLDESSARPAMVADLPATAESIREARERVAAFAATHGVNGELVDDIRLAVSEAVTNIVMHAYPDEPGVARVLAVIDGDQLAITIEDDGCGLGGTSRRPGLGVGLQVMRATAAQALIDDRETGGATVQLRFACAS